MTRSVDDAALMMSVLSRPDRRDGMSLPPNDIDWKALDKSICEAAHRPEARLGFGQPLEPEVREVAMKAAQARSRPRAPWSPRSTALTREMINGLDDFWRARSWDDVSRITTAERGKALPYIYQWAETGAKLSGVDVVRGFNVTMAVRPRRQSCFATSTI